MCVCVCIATISKTLMWQKLVIHVSRVARELWANKLCNIRSSKHWQQSALLKPTIAHTSNKQSTWAWVPHWVIIKQTICIDILSSQTKLQNPSWILTKISYSYFNWHWRLIWNVHPLSIDLHAMCNVHPLLAITAIENDLLHDKCIFRS